ncbi:hypothetical protein HTVC304P_gp49 [Pelagibacter phage HTVC304P]|jgi:hypothetical protein|nr:hypothetical protein P201_gp46 [Pelagibacter phage HTVC201P]WMM95032.1 hypothetical protein HTVC304P_gp49 [Pelagibacter phage HTVC304P]
MIIYGYSVKTWRDKAIIYWRNTNKKLFTLFVLWSIILWAM